MRKRVALSFPRSSAAFLVLAYVLAWCCGPLAISAAAQNISALPTLVAKLSASFTFAAIGDQPYELPREPVRFDRLIRAINKQRPAFTVHAGDIISGQTRCSEENFATVKARFNGFDNGLVYTPGDNEWTDCHRLFSGRYDPLERLSVIRRMFFADPSRSLGRRPLSLVSQARLHPDRFGLYVENSRFVKNGVVFSMVHIVGSKNNFRPRDANAVAEYQARELASLFWINEAFRLGTENKAPALVFVWQANVHATPRFNRSAPFSPVYTKVIDAIEAGARRFGRPVLVISGDFHIFDVAPFLNVQRKPVPNVTRLQVFGADQVHGTLVTVNPGAKDVFVMKPLMVSE